MLPELSHHWKPKRILRFVQAHHSGSEVLQVETDSGRAFAKLLGGKEGPHVLACELIGTRLAGLLGLPTLDWTLISYPGIPELRLHSGSLAAKGTCWLTRGVRGMTWSRRGEDLKLISNPQDIVKLVLMDQWTRNCDRYRPGQPPRVNLGNVFLSRDKSPTGQLQLMAMDHTHIFTCGRPLTKELLRIDLIKDVTAFGVFAEFEPFIRFSDAERAIVALKSVTRDQIQAICSELPDDWDVPASMRAILADFLCQRQDWLTETFVPRLCPQGELPLQLDS
jgi:hypothetical protein